MPVSPDEIQLDAEQQAQIAALAEKQQKPRRELLQTAIDYLQSDLVCKTAAIPHSRRWPGNGKGKVWTAPDFDEPLDELKDYV